MLKTELQDILNAYEKLKTVAELCTKNLSTKDYILFLNSKNQNYAGEVSHNDNIILNHIITKGYSSVIDDFAVTALIINFKNIFDLIHFTNGTMLNYTKFCEHMNTFDEYEKKLMELKPKVQEILNLTVEVIKKHFDLFKIKVSDKQESQLLESDNMSNEIKHKLFLYKNAQDVYNCVILINSSVNLGYHLKMIPNKLRLINDIIKATDELQIKISDIEFLNSPPVFVTSGYSPIFDEDFEYIVSAIKALIGNEQMINIDSAEPTTLKAEVFSYQEQCSDGWHINDDINCGLYKCTRCGKTTWVSDDDKDEIKYCCKCGALIKIEQGGNDLC